jgi:hypothetical protein
MHNNGDHFWHLLWTGCVLFVISWPVGVSVVLLVHTGVERVHAISLPLFCWTGRTACDKLPSNFLVLG